MTKAEYVADITAKLPKGLTLDEQSTNAELDTILNTLNAVEEVDAVKEDLASANKKVEDLTNELEQTQNELLDLNTQLSDATAVSAAAGGAKASVKVGGKLYIIKCGAKLPIGENVYSYSKEDIAANKKEEGQDKGCAEILVEMGSIVLKPITEG